MSRTRKQTAYLGRGRQLMATEPIDIRFGAWCGFVEALRNLNHEAKRMQTVLGTPTLPTRWDYAHKRIDALLELIAGR